MKVLVHGVIGVLGLWLQSTVAPSIAIAQIRPNAMLLTLIVLVLRWPSPWLFVYGALAGLALDSFSHGMLGVYAISFLLVALATRVAGDAIYENNLLSSLLAVFAMTVLHGGLALAIFKVLDAGTPWWWWMMTRVIPEGLYTAALAPLFFLAHEWLERRLRWGRESWEM